MNDPLATIKLLYEDTREDERGFGFVFTNKNIGFMFWKWSLELVIV